MSGEACTAGCGYCGRCSPAWDDADEPIQVVCAWHQPAPIVMKDGREPATHSICQACIERVEREYREDRNEQHRRELAREHTGRAVEGE